MMYISDVRLIVKVHGERNQRLKRRLYRRLKLRFLIVVQNNENRRFKRLNRRLKPRHVASFETTTRCVGWNYDYRRMKLRLSSFETTMDRGLKRLCSYALLNWRRSLIQECKSIVISNDDIRRLRRRWSRRFELRCPFIISNADFSLRVDMYV